jgi:hypothetical protein
MRFFLLLREEMEIQKEAVGTNFLNGGQSIKFGYFFLWVFGMLISQNAT